MLDSGGTVTWESVVIVFLVPVIGALLSVLWWSLRTQITGQMKIINELEKDQAMQNDRLSRLEIRSEGHTAGIQRLENKLDQINTAIYEMSRTVTDRIDKALVNVVRVSNEE